MHSSLFTNICRFHFLFQFSSLCFKFFFILILLLCLSYSRFRYRSISVPLFYLLIRSYSLDFSVSSGFLKSALHTFDLLYCNCDVVCCISKYKYWKFISFFVELIVVFFFSLSCKRPQVLKRDWRMNKEKKKKTRRKHWKWEYAMHIHLNTNGGEIE